MAEVIDIDRERDVRLGLVCARCGRPDCETNREHDLYCDACYLIVLGLED